MREEDQKVKSLIKHESHCPTQRQCWKTPSQFLPTLSAIVSPTLNECLSSMVNKLLLDEMSEGMNGFLQTPCSSPVFFSYQVELMFYSFC